GRTHALPPPAALPIVPRPDVPGELLALSREPLRQRDGDDDAPGRRRVARLCLSRSAFLLGLIGLVQFVPALALTLVGGALADSYDRRRIMMRAQVVPLVSAAALFLATRSGAVTLPLLYGVILLVAVAGAFESPSRMAP